MAFDLIGTVTFVATGDNFPDALAGSAMAGTGPFTVLLVSPNMPQTHVKILKAGNEFFKHKYILGGEAIVRQSMLDELFHA